MNRTFGSDPELLVVKDGKPVSAIGIVQGDIEHRISLKGHQFYYDNVLAECAIKPGASKKEVLDNFMECFQIYADMVRPFRLVPQASVTFPDEQLEHPDARKVGCAKDMCAYELVIKEAPTDAICNGNLRSCGGHIHLGSETLTADGPEPILALYMLDLMLGVPSLWLDQDPSSGMRRRLYGQAGRYRVKPYGLEYRSLGNFWLASPAMTSLVYDLSMHAIDLVESGKAWELWDFSWDRFFESDSGSLAAAWECKAYNPEDVKQGINLGDKGRVAPLFDLAKQYMTPGLRSDVDKAVARKGDGDFYENWRLTA